MSYTTAMSIEKPDKRTSDQFVTRIETMKPEEISEEIEYIKGDDSNDDLENIFQKILDKVTLNKSLYYLVESGNGISVMSKVINRDQDEIIYYTADKDEMQALRNGVQLGN